MARRTSPLDDLLSWLTRQSWSTLLIVAGVILATTNWLLPVWFAGGSPSTSGTTGFTPRYVLATFAPAIAQLGFWIAIVLAVFAAYRLVKPIGSPLDQVWTISKLHGLSWRAFETLVADAYRAKGYRVTHHGGPGPDGGIDLVLERGEETIFVQCKHWRDRTVGVKPVRELYGVTAANPATGSIMVTSGFFSNEARDFAENIRLTLVSGPDLCTMLNLAPEHAQQTRIATRNRSTHAGALSPRTAHPVHGMHKT